jgi:hypothetical protein
MVISRISDMVSRIQRHPRAKMLVVHPRGLAPYLGAARDEQPKGGINVSALLAEATRPDAPYSSANVFRVPSPGKFSTDLQRTSNSAFLKASLHKTPTLEKVMETAGDTW